MFRKNQSSKCSQKYYGFELFHDSFCVTSTSQTRRADEINLSDSKLKYVLTSDSNIDEASREAPFHFVIKSDSVGCFAFIFWNRTKGLILYIQFLLFLRILSCQRQLRQLLRRIRKSSALYDPLIILMSTIPFPLLLFPKAKQ